MKLLPFRRRQPAPVLARIKSQWRAEGNGGTPEGVAAFSDLLFMGRAVGIRLVVGQIGGASAYHFGPEGREAFSHIVSRRVSQRTWAWLTAAEYPTDGDKHPGLFYDTSGGFATPFRALLMTPAEAGDVATSGREEAY